MWDDVAAAIGMANMVVAGALLLAGAVLAGIAAAIKIIQVALGAASFPVLLV